MTLRTGSGSPFLALSFLMLGLLASVAAMQTPTLQEPAIAADFGVSTGAVELVATIFLLFSGALIVTLGKLADVHGRRTIFLLSVVAFALACLLAAVAPAFWVLLVARAVQGAALAGIGASAVGLVNAEFTQPRERGIAFAIWGTAFGLGFVLATLLGPFTPWRVSFLVQAVLGLVAAVGAWRFAARSPRRTESFDVMGTVWLTVGLFSLMVALAEGTGYGWLTPLRPLEVGGGTLELGASWVFWLLVLAGISLVGLLVNTVRRSRAGKVALLDPELFRSRRFTWGCVTAVLFFGGTMGVIELLPLYLQTAAGMDATRLALTYLPIGVGWSLFALAAGPIGARLGARNATLVGIGVGGVALVVLAPLVATTAEPWTLLVPLLVLGAGMGLVYSRISDVVLVEVPGPKSSLGGGMLVMFRLVAIAVGTAALTAVLLVAGTNDALEAVTTDTSLSSSDRSTVVEDLEASLTRRSGSADGGTSTIGGGGRSLGSSADQQAYVAAADAGLTSGMRWVVVAGLVVVGLSIATGLRIPGDHARRDTAG